MAKVDEALTLLAQQEQQALANAPQDSTTQRLLRQAFEKQRQNIMSQGAILEPLQQPSQAETRLSEIAEEQLAETAPIRTGFLQQAEDILSGTTSPQDLPFFAPAFAEGKRALEGQFGRAREDILGFTTPGGTQQELLSNLAGQRAEQVGSLPSMISQNLMQDILNKATGFAFGAPGQAMGAFGTAGGLDLGRNQAMMGAQSNMFNTMMGLQGMREQMEAQQPNALAQMFGYALGGGFNPQLKGLAGLFKQPEFAGPGF
jgi:hypothetical protein